VTDRNISRRPLTELQQAILDFISDKGSATSEEIREGLRTRHPLKDSSVRTLLRRLEARGYVSHRVEGTDVVLHVEQIGELFDVPVTVTLQYADRKPVDVLIRVTERSVDRRVPLEGVLRGIEVSKDDGTMAEIVKS